MLRTTRKAVRAGGSTMSDTHQRCDKEHQTPILELDIANHENAASRKLIKKIYIANTVCGMHKKCRSHVMNP